MRVRRSVLARLVAGEDDEVEIVFDDRDEAARQRADRTLTDDVRTELEDLLNCRRSLVPRVGGEHDSGELLGDDGSQFDLYEYGLSDLHADGEDRVTGEPLAHVKARMLQAAIEVFDRRVKDVRVYAGKPEDDAGPTRAETRRSGPAPRTLRVTITGRIVVDVASERSSDPAEAKFVSTIDGFGSVTIDGGKPS